MEIKEQLKIQHLARKLSLFTDPVRLKLFFFLFSSKNEDLCVSDVAAFLKSSISNTSHQLRKLELADVVEARRHGRMICYRVKKTLLNVTLYKSLKKIM